MTIQIEKDIPAPAKFGSDRHNFYPWKTMEVGDSFLFPSNRSRDAAYNATRFANFRHQPRKFAMKSTPDGYRCWRVA